MYVTPITPSEAADKGQFPDEVILAFNELIAKHLNGRSSTFPQEEVIELIKAKTRVSRWDILDRHWLEVTVLYDNPKAGWIVRRLEPIRNRGDALFIFTAMSRP